MKHTLITNCTTPMAYCRTEHYSKGSFELTRMLGFDHSRYLYSVKELCCVHSNLDELSKQISLCGRNQPIKHILLQG